MRDAAPLRAALKAEWLKLFSVRSTFIALLAAAAAAVGVGMLETASVAARWRTMPAPVRTEFDAVGTSFAGLEFGVLAFGVLGVLAVTSEYATGMIYATLAAVPRRGLVFAARAVVVAGVTLAVGEVLALSTFFAGQSMLARAELDVGLTQPGVLRTVLQAGLYLSVVAIVGMGIGALCRNAAAALAGLFGLLFAAYAVARALEPWSYLPDRLLLANAADVLGQVHVHAGNPLRVPSLAFAYVDLALYVAVFVSLGAWRALRDPG